MSFFDDTLYTCQLPDEVSAPHACRPATEAGEAQRLNARARQEQVGALCARLVAPRRLPGGGCFKSALTIERICTARKG
jgi:hypothetical protein